MNDSLDAIDARPDTATLIQNCYPKQGLLVGRPGFASVGTVGTLIQAMFSAYNSSGTLYNIVVSAGEIYTVNYSTSTITKVVSAANLATASVTLATSGEVYWVLLNGKVIFSDNANKPFQWDFTSGAGGLTSLTNAPVIYGPPTVYYGKLFGIKNTARNTFVWSEENDPTTGYEAGGYNNAWDFTQTSSEPMRRLLGTNEALYIFRANSISTVTGAVDTDFATSGTRSSISETVGTRSTPIYSGRNIFFWASSGRPYIIRPGGEAESMWEPLRNTLPALDSIYTSLFRVVDLPSLNLVLFHYMDSTGSTGLDRIAVYDVTATPRCVGIWRGFTHRFASVIISETDGQPHLVHCSLAGALYLHDAATLNDDGAAIEHVVQAMPMAVDPSGEKFFDRVDWELRNTAMTNSYQYVTPRTSGSTAQAPGVATTRHQALGINAHGRWIAPKVTHSTVSQSFGVASVRVRGVVTTNAPGNL